MILQSWLFSWNETVAKSRYHRFAHHLSARRHLSSPLDLVSGLVGPKRVDRGLKFGSERSESARWGIVHEIEESRQIQEKMFLGCQVAVSNLATMGNYSDEVKRLQGPSPTEFDARINQR